MSDLAATEELIADALQDAVDAPEGEQHTTPDATPQETPSEPVAASEEPLATVVTPEAPPQEDQAVTSPAAAHEPPSVDDTFAKEWGISPQMSSGRENRIPYSRVKTMVEKAQKKALEPVTAQLTEVQGKVSDYETRLAKVGEFEHILMNDPQKFMNILATIPAYKPLFDILQAKIGEASAPPPTPQPVPQGSPQDEMPAPDQKLADGTLVYSMDGLKALMAWERQEAKKEAVAEISQRYQPFEEEVTRTRHERLAQEHLNQLIPQIQSQIAEARTWPQFNDHEPAIVAALNANPMLDLKGAYIQVVMPKLHAGLAPARDKMRAELLKEIQAAPTGPTSAPSGRSRPGAEPTGRRTTEEIIAESIKHLG